ncbi:hypothetical protein C8R42DRAFT_727932 [Lentinula raphanica]|nr:hypothetical protein C8R42DRAFT_727922 [Lentinula raphanica]KAJ3712402.1 hypothetical protein C8R42DRAFT_727932 [Lentinula raphanica]
MTPILASTSSSSRVILISDSSDDEDDELAQTMSKITLSRGRASPTKRPAEFSNAVVQASPKKELPRSSKIQEQINTNLFNNPPVYVFRQGSDELYSVPPPQYSEPAEAARPSEPAGPSEAPSDFTGVQSEGSQALPSPALSLATLPPFSPPPVPPATPRHRRGQYNAYVVYSGREAFVYDRWSRVKQLKEQDPNLVFKGFPTRELAQASWNAARTSGVVSALQQGMGRGYWVVTQGVHPEIYRSAYDALRDGLEWGGGFLTAFSSEAEAQDYWNTQSNADPCRIVSTERPGFFT